MAKVAAQNEAWRRAVIEQKELEVKKGAPFITISRQFGCGAFPLAEALAVRLSESGDKDYPWAVYDRALVEKIAKDHKLSADLVSSLGRDNRSELEESVLGLLNSFTPELRIYRSLVETVRALAMHGKTIIIGRGGAILTAGIPAGFHLRLIAPLEWRIKRVMEIFEIDRQTAEKKVARMDKEREKFLRKYLNTDPANVYFYHIIFNNAKMTTEMMVNAVLEGMKIMFL
jgi:cytidylate kinase